MGTPSEVAEQLAALVELALEQHPDDSVVSDFLPRYFREVPDDDMTPERSREVLDAALAHLELGRHRAEGEVSVVGRRLVRR